jgi:thiamine phosphate synthase YjbQ (UPF0047 family)
MVKALVFQTAGQGLQEITAQVDAAVRAAGIEEGLCTLFVRHTSASLVIQEILSTSTTRRARTTCRRTSRPR